MVVGGSPHRGALKTGLAAVVLLLVIVLLAHGIVMGVHIPEAGCATCVVAILVAAVGALLGAALAPRLVALELLVLQAGLGGIEPEAAASRHPPRVGPVLRL